MIVPSTTLIRWFGWVGLPLALMAAVEPRLGEPMGALAVVAIALSVLDALRALPRAQGVSVSVRSPLRLVVGEAQAVPVHWAARNAGSRIELAVDWPAAVGAATIQCAAEPAPCGVVRWPCRPAARGRYRLGAAAVAVHSPWGLWEVRRRIALDAELHLLPNLRDERRRVAAQFLVRGGAGLRRRRPVGKGREFEKLREYVPGDDYGDIHWKATARRRHPVTKLFQIERTQEVVIAVDASRLAGRPAPRRAGEAGAPTQLDRFVATALMLCAAAREQGDRFGLLLFDRTVRQFVPAGHGAAHLHRCRDALLGAAPVPVSPDHAELFAFVRGRLRKRALIVVLAGLDDAAAAAGFAAAAAAAARQHLVIAFTLRAPDARPLLSGPPPATLDEAYRHLDGHERWRRIEELRRALRRLGVVFEAVDDERLSAAVISRYVEARERQRL
ncbi:MAG: DUF58 domain-containing protein [Kiritimatiellae bacterium]|nr:DUF58 domain-containing protein [Kiritimatiellia bacterium]